MYYYSVANIINLNNFSKWGNNWPTAENPNNGTKAFMDYPLKQGSILLFLFIYFFKFIYLFFGGWPNYKNKMMGGGSAMKLKMVGGPPCQKKVSKCPLYTVIDVIALPTGDPQIIALFIKNYPIMLETTRNNLGTHSAQYGCEKKEKMQINK